MMKKMVLISVSIIFAIFLIITIALLILSPGTIKTFKDSTGKELSGSIAEKVFVTIGGVKQGMIIKSKNNDNPVLLYLHGGPAFPNYFLIDKFEPGLEDYFTVCYWEQRGGGLSYSPEVSLKSMNLKQLSEDAIEVSKYLINRFGKEKIFIMAHSGGTPIALVSVAKSPELYYAYIAMAQITNQAESEKIAYKYMLEKYKSMGNKSSVKSLLDYSVLKSDTNLITYYKSVDRDQSMHELGIGTMHKMNSIFMDIFLPVWTCSAYTLSEKINIWKSKFFFLPKTNLANELLSTDFTKIIQKIDVPIYFFSGKYDLTVNKDLSKEYLNRLVAPIKGFYTFYNSAHSPLFEEPKRVREIIEKEILNFDNKLAD